MGTDTKPPKPQSSDDISLQGIPNEVLSEPLEEFADGTMAIENANTQPLISTTQFKYLLVKVRVGDILLSTHPIAELVDETTDCGMVEFLPRNVDGFRQELEFCMDDRIPFITGSLSAHECCAISAIKQEKKNLFMKRRRPYLIMLILIAVMLVVGQCHLDQINGVDLTGNFIQILPLFLSFHPVALSSVKEKSFIGSLNLKLLQV